VRRVFDRDGESGSNLISGVDEVEIRTEFEVEVERRSETGVQSDHQLAESPRIVERKDL